MLARKINNYSKEIIMMTAKTQKITEQTSEEVKKAFNSLPPERLAALVTAAGVSNRICPLSAPVASAPILPRRVTPRKVDTAGSPPSRQDSPPEFVAPLPIPKKSASTLSPIEQSPEGMRPETKPLPPPAPGFGRLDDAEEKKIRKIIEALPYPDTGNHENINLWYGKVEECLREGRVDRARRIAKAAPHLDLRSHLLTNIARYLEQQGKLTDAISIAREVPEHFIQGAALQGLIDPLERAGRYGTARVIEAERPETYVRRRDSHSNVDDSDRRK